MSTPELAEVSWYVRRPAPEGGWYYDHIDVRSPGGSAQPVRFVPAVGDVVTVGGEDPGTGKTSGTFRVIDRTWLYPSWGSMNWPHGQTEPTRGPMVQILMEEARGLFVDERTRPEDEADL